MNYLRNASALHAKIETFDDLGVMEISFNEPIVTRSEGMINSAVLKSQIISNRNHPNSLIAEDFSYTCIKFNS